MTKPILFLAALMCVALAGAQTHGPEYLTFLLRYPSVRKDLGLSAAASAKIANAEKQSDTRYFEMISPKPGTSYTRHPTAAQVAAEAKRRDAAILAALGAAQKKRLREIGLQYSGAFALGDTKVAKDLRLSFEQIKKLQEVETQGLNALRAQMGGMTGPGKRGNGAVNPKEQMAKISAARLKMMRSLAVEAAKVLTAKQRAQWKTMQGKPFPIAELYKPVPARVAAH